MMRKTIKFGAALAGLTLAATVVGTSPAAAGTRDCRYGNFCAWTDDNFSGGIAQWGGNDPSWYDNGMHDNAESVYNNGNSAYTNDHVQVFETSTTETSTSASTPARPTTPVWTTTTTTRTSG